MISPLRTSRLKSNGYGLIIAILLYGNILPAQPIPIAVLEFEGNGISQTEAIALTDRLRNELFRLGVFEVVERGMMETILNEQDFQLTGCTSNECLVEVGQLLGARQVVGGRISRVGAMFTVSARVVDVQTGKLLGVSDFDLRGGLEEMLTDGMKRVAVVLSGDDEVVDLSRLAEMPEAQATPLVGPRRYHWQLLAGNDGYGPIYLASYYARRELNLGNTIIYPAVTLGGYEYFGFGTVEFHVPFRRERTLLSIFFGGGLIGGDITITTGAQAGAKLFFFPLIVVEFRLVTEGFGEIIPSLGAGIRL